MTRGGSRHHIAHEAVFWNAHSSTRAIRQTHSLIPRIDRGVHDELHRACNPVPVLSTYVMNRVNMQFEPIDSTFRDIDLLCRAFDRATKRSTTIEREMAGLAIESIRAQIPYIQEGMRVA